MICMGFFHLLNSITMTKTLLTISCVLTLNALQAQTNTGFETWTGADPAGWTTLNGITALGGPVTTVVETAAPAVGTNSAKLMTVTCLVCPTLTLPNPLPGVAIQTLSYTARPATVTVKWRGTVATNDTSVIGAYLTLAGANIGAAEFQLLGGTNQATWLTQIINFNYASGSVPDTMAFGAAADQYLIKGYSGTSSTSTVIYVDDYVFAGGTVGIETLETSNELILAYPNPTNTVVNFNLLGTDATNMQVIDLTGKTVYTENNILSKHILNIENYTNGSYVVKFFNDKKEFVGSTRFNVVK